jgi:hypothetical protein
MGAEGVKLLGDLSNKELEAVIRFLSAGIELNERHALRVRALAAGGESEPPAA